VRGSAPTCIANARRADRRLWLYCARHKEPRMSELVRLSISLDRPLAERLERLVASSRYTNRSEFIRDLIRQQLVEQQWTDTNQEVVGTITLVYNHHARQLADKLIDIQHDHHDSIMATTHVHLSHDVCAEMIMLRGPAPQIRQVADRLRQQRGVLHAALAMSSTGDHLA
jgi:CopG family nickel-responsive transcriptional regulator